MSAGPSTDLDKRVPVQVSMTLRQLREISKRAHLGAFDGRARSEYIIGCVFGEPHGDLLERVHHIRDADRVRLRAELRFEGAAQAAREAERNEREALNPAR